MKGSAHAWLGAGALLVAAGAWLNACSAADGAAGSGGGSASNAASAGTGSGHGGAANGSGVTGAGGDPTFTTGALSSASSGMIDEDAACASVTSQATSELAPADIVIAVDTSGSMDEESAQVQANLNNFATIIKNSGIDVHVILIADNSVCIPSPFGSGACNGADEKLPEYRHVLQGVGSTNGLQVILDTYPQWKASLRPNATKTIAIVSDDNSSLNAASFTNALLALDPPTFQGFKFDAIIAFDSPDVCSQCFLDCTPCIAQSACCYTGVFVCESFSADEGTVYKQLVSQTGGVIGDLCIQDFGPVFQDMATSIVQNTQLSCEYPIPPVPGGGTIDPTKVNVNYTPGGGQPQPILYVPNGASGCGMNGGWYYDDPINPTKIIICPTTCMTLQSDPNGMVEVLFGCDTQVKPPE
jgi:hypothetical protein